MLTLYADSVAGHVHAYIKGVVHTYDDTHELTTGDLDEDHILDVQGAGLNIQKCGQTKVSHGEWPYWSWQIWRGALVFDVSPWNGKTAASAKIIVHAESGANPDFTPTNYMVLVPGSDIASSGMVQADYEELVNDTTNYGRIADSDYTEDEDNDIPFTSAGVTALQAAMDASGYFIVGLRNQYDINKDSADDGGQDDQWFSFVGGPNASGDMRPRLEIYGKGFAQII